MTLFVVLCLYVHREDATFWTRTFEPATAPAPPRFKPDTYLISIHRAHRIRRRGNTAQNVSSPMLKPSLAWISFILWMRGSLVLHKTDTFACSFRVTFKLELAFDLELTWPSWSPSLVSTGFFKGRVILIFCSFVWGRRQYWFKLL